MKSKTERPTAYVGPTTAAPPDRRGWKRFASWVGVVPLVVMATLGVLHSQEQSEWERPSRPAPQLGGDDGRTAAPVARSVPMAQRTRATSRMTMFLEFTEEGPQRAR